MSEVRTIICLANSHKHLDRCIAGVEVRDRDTLTWIRPVSFRGGHGISFSERRLQDGSEPAVLDSITVGLIGPQPHLHQKENWLLDHTVAWAKVERPDPHTLLDFLDLLSNRGPLGPLWIDGPSSSHGVNDKVPDAELAALPSSLCLIRVDRVDLHAGYEWGKRALRAHFRHAGNYYALKVTDPVFQDAYRSHADGVYPLGSCFLTVSLTEQFDDYACKVVAAVIPQTQLTGESE